VTRITRRWPEGQPVPHRARMVAFADRPG